MQIPNTRYFKALLKPVNIMLSLLIALVLSTVYYMGVSVGLWNAVLNNSPYLYYTICVIAVFSIFISLYVFFSAKKATADLSDTIPLSMMLFSIISLICLIITGNVTGISVLFVLFPLLLGLLLFCANLFSYDPDIKKSSNVIYTTNDVTAYFKTFFKKYSLLMVLGIAGLFTCFTTMFFHPHFGFGLDGKKIAILVISALPIIFYFAYNAGNKDITEADLVTFSLFITMPIALCEILIFNQVALARNLTIWAICFCALALYMFMRLRTFDFTERPAPMPIEKKSFFGYYVKSLLRNYNLMFIISIALFMAVSLFMLFPISQLSKNFIIANGKLSLNADYFLVAIIDSAIILMILFSALFSLINLPSAKINFADFMLAVLIVFSLVGLVLLSTVINLVEIITLFVILLFGLAFLFARARAVYYK